MKDFTIAKAARHAGVGVETIRFYERRGLIEQPAKPQGSGFRVYSPELIKRIKFIRQAQHIGFSLHEIQELLSLKADPKADCSAVRSQAVAKLEEVKRKITQLREIGAALETLIALCPGRGGLAACGILDTLSDPGHGRVAAIATNRSPAAVLPTRKSRSAKTGSNRRQQRRAQVKSVTLKVQGMHCDGCAETIKALLEHEPGVKTTSVSFASGEARILYDPAMTNEERLATVVERPGYRVTARAP